MDQVKAMRATLELAQERDYWDIDFEEIGVDFDHLKSMVERIEGMPDEYSEAKKGRWLGYMQGVLVANAVMTLEEAKEINRRFSG